MDDEIEIDLKKIIRALLQRWKWIGAIAFLAGVLGFVFSYLQPRVYEASAVITLTRPSEMANFDPRYQTVNPLTINNKIAMDIAMGDEVVKILYDAWKSPEKDKVAIDTFKNYLEAKGGSDPNIVILAVRLKDAQEAARLAKLWATELVKRVNLTFGGRDEIQVKFFEKQLADSQQIVAAAAQALQNFEARNERAELQNKLDSLLNQQNEWLRRIRVIEAIQADGRLFLEQLRSLPGESRLSSQEQTNLFLLQMRIYGDTLAGISSASQYQLVVPAAQYQLVVPNLTSEMTVAEYQKNLSAWLDSLETQKSDVKANLDEILPQIEDLQGQIQGLDNQRKKLDLDYNLATETLTTLSRKYDETRIAVQDSNGFASIASYPVAPKKPVSRHTLRNSGLAFVLGAFVAVFGVLVWDWWTSEEDEKIPPE